MSSPPSLKPPVGCRVVAFDPVTWPAWLLFATLLVGAVAILVGGTMLTSLADRLADQTGWGEAVFGAVVLGASTSLAGSLLSISTAYQGFPDLSAANAVGGIAVQTAFLVVADITYRRANLEHAAASLENMLLGALLVIMLAVPLVARSSPDGTVLGIHPATVLLFAAYVFGLRVVQSGRGLQAWTPRATLDTRTDEPDEPRRRFGAMVWGRFVALVAVTGVAGLAVGQAGIGLVERYDLQADVVGALLTAVVTSLPELVVTLAAVRRGALTLAVGGIIGGNSFDVLFLAFSDIAYRPGSLYHAMGTDTSALLSIGIVMTGVLLLGLLRREQRGFGGIGFEGVAILALYGLAVFLVAL